LINAELYLLAASAASPAYAGLPILIMGTLGQMTAKVVMFYGGRGAIRLPSRRLAQKLEQAAAQVEQWRGSTGLMIFVSALVGLPPFFVISVVCGMMRTSVWSFVILGTLGRFLRFAPFVFFPEFAKSLL
jgi:membrane protein YqaA with SNARE-associated domain